MEPRLRMERGAPVAQWVKRWPADLAVPGSSPAWGEDLSGRKRGSTASSPQAEFEPGIRRRITGPSSQLISGLYFSFGLNLKPYPCGGRFTQVLTNNINI